MYIPRRYQAAVAVSMYYVRTLAAVNVNVKLQLYHVSLDFRIIMLLLY